MNLVRYIFCTLLFCGLTAYSAQAQTDSLRTEVEKRLVQFSGILVTSDSLQPLPYVTIFDKNTGRGTISDYYGFFSFVALKGDTIVFSSVGYRKSTFVIPDTLSDNRYSLIQIMRTDTIMLEESVINAWPSREQFAEAFINLEIPDDYLARAQRNLNMASLTTGSLAMSNDGYMTYRHTLQMERNRMLSQAGQIPTANLLSPVAWYKFVQAWKNGDFRRKD